MGLLISAVNNLGIRLHAGRLLSIQMSHNEGIIYFELALQKYSQDGGGPPTPTGPPSLLTFPFQWETNPMASTDTMIEFVFTFPKDNFCGPM